MTDAPEPKRADGAARALWIAQGALDAGTTHRRAIEDPLVAEYMTQLVLLAVEVVVVQRRPGDVGAFRATQRDRQEPLADRGRGRVFLRSVEQRGVRFPAGGGQVSQLLRAVRRKIRLEPVTRRCFRAQLDRAQ